MSFIFHCPHCNQKLEAKEEWIGQQVDCPSCKASITVLTPVPDEVQKLKEDERYCPFCGEIIKKRAIICRFCREKLDDVSASGDVPLVENGIAVQKTTSSDCVSHSENNGNTPSDNPDKRYNLYLYESKDSIETIKTIRGYLQCGLKEAKDFLEKDSLPSKILTGESIAKSMEFKRLLETSGASVKILEVGSEEDKLCEKEINLPPDKTPVQEDAVKNIRNDSGKPNDNVGWGTGLVFLALAALLLWLGWLFVTGYPRTTFWIFAPIVGCVILCYADKLNKVVIILLCCGIVFWGWWAHMSGNKPPLTVSCTKENEQRSDGGMDFIHIMEIKNESPTETLKVYLYFDGEREGSWTLSPKRTGKKVWVNLYEKDNHKYYKKNPYEVYAEGYKSPIKGSIDPRSKWYKQFLP